MQAPEALCAGKMQVLISCIQEKDSRFANLKPGDRWAQGGPRRLVKKNIGEGVNTTGV